MTSFLTYILQAGITLAIFYAIYEILLKRDTFFQLNRIFLVSGLLLAFLIPAIPITSPFKAPVSPPSLDVASASFAAEPASAGPAVFLFVLYWAGAALFLIRFGFQLAGLRRVVRRNGVRRLRGVKVVAVDRSFPPFSFLDTVFLSKSLADDGNLRRILAHEEVHIHQQHTLDVLLMEIVLSFQWFNPLVWPYKKALQATHEYLADSGVIAQGFSSVKYQLLMFEQHIGASLFEFGNNFKKSQVKRRIMMLSKAKSPKAAKLKPLLVLPLAFGLVLMFAEPRTAATAGTAGGAGMPAPQEQGGQATGPASQKIAEAQKEAKKLAMVEKDLRAKLEATEDAAPRDELKKKLESVIKERKHVEAFLAESGAAPPAPPASPEELKAEYKSLIEKEATVRAELEKATDESKKTDLAKLLDKIHAKEAAVKDMIAHTEIAAPSVEELEDGLAKLQVKEKDIRAQLKAATDPEKKAELENMLNKVLKSQSVCKANLEKARAAKSAKSEKTAK
jgi:hypothetical protein